MLDVSGNRSAAPDIAGPIDVAAAGDSRLSIAEMAETFDVTLRALRFYEEKGLLNPERRGARRFYRGRDIGRMRVILQAKRLGLTLSEIREVISLVEGRKDRKTQLTRLREICRHQDELLKEQQIQLSEQIAEMGGVLEALDGLLEGALVK